MFAWAGIFLGHKVQRVVLKNGSAGKIMSRVYHVEFYGMSRLMHVYHYTCIDSTHRFFSVLTSHVYYFCPRISHYILLALILSSKIYKSVFAGCVLVLHKAQIEHRSKIYTQLEEKLVDISHIQNIFLSLSRESLILKN